MSKKLKARDGHKATEGRLKILSLEAKKETIEELPTGTKGPSAFLGQWISKVKPKKFTQLQKGEPDASAELPATSQDVDQVVADLISKNPKAGAAQFYNLLKSKGIKLKMEAEMSSGHPELVREKSDGTPLGNLAIKSNRFLESSIARDPALGFTRFKVVLLEEGMGNLKDAYFYSKDALKSAISVFEGAKIFADHPTAIDEKIRPERSVRDVLGHFENIAVQESDDGQMQLVGDVMIPPDEPFLWARSLMGHAVEYAKKFGDKDFIGLSINASGDASEQPIDQLIESAPDGAKVKLLKAKEQGIDKVKVVSVIDSCVSCDLVTEAGAGGKVLEMMEKEKQLDEGGPGSGRRKGGGKAEQNPSIKKSGKVDYLKHANDFEKSGRGSFSRAGKSGTDLHMHTADWASARAFNDKIGGHGDIQPDALSGRIIVKVPNAYKHISKEGIMSKKTKKKEADQQDPSKLKAEADGAAPEKHDDEAQDVELIKSMIKKYLGGEEEPSTEEESLVKEAYEACKEMGMEGEEAEKAAVHQLKLAKHLAAKQAESAEAEESEEAEAEECGPMKAGEAEESHKEANVALSAKLAKTEAELSKYKMAEAMDKMLSESKLPTAATKKFRESVADVKSITEAQKLFKIFEAGYKADEKKTAGPISFESVFTQPEKSQGQAGGKAGMFDGVFKK